MIETHVMRLLDFSNVLEVACDSTELAISGVLSHENYLVAYFSEKLNDVRQRYSTCNKEFYVVVQALRYWRYYLLPQKFVLYSDHEALKYSQLLEEAKFMA